jgi:hypothetical protein
LKLDFKARRRLSARFKDSQAGLFAPKPIGGGPSGAREMPNI